MVRRHTWDLLEDVLGNTLQWDSRLWLTLKLLFLRPGQLARDWIEGKRARYVPPFRLYIIASFILFLLLGTFAGRNMDRNPTGPETPAVVSIDENSEQSLDEAIEEARADGNHITEAFLVGARKALENPREFRSRIFKSLPKAAFLLLPAFALLHMLVNIRRERFYIDYLVFSLHLHAFAFMVIAVIFVLGLISHFLDNASELLALVIPVYVAVGFKTFSGQGWGKSILKAILVMGAYLVVLLAGIVLFFVVILIF